MRARHDVVDWATFGEVQAATRRRRDACMVVASGTKEINRDTTVTCDTHAFYSFLFACIIL